MNPNVQSNYQDYPFLLNPYQQITCWLMHRIHQPDIGDKMKTLLLELKELLLAFDKINKDRYSFSLDNWNPYNVWMDIVISEYVNPFINEIEERLFFKGHNPERFIRYSIGIDGLHRMIEEKNLIFEPAFPDKQAREKYENIYEQISNLDWLCKKSNATSGGMGLNDAFYYLTDNNRRESIEDNFMFEEPSIYPTYMVYPKPYKLGQKVEVEGVYLPDSPLKDIKMFAHSDTEKILETLIYIPDIPKLGQPIRKIEGDIEYGLHDSMSPYFDNPNGSEEDFVIYGKDWIETDWYYIKEIPPNTAGVPNNPLRLEHLRYPLKANQEYITLDQLKQRDGYVYENPDAMVEQYYQVINRYEKFYKDYLLARNVDFSRLQPYQ